MKYFLIFALFSYIILIPLSTEIKFIRTIEAVGMPFYKISLRLGFCQKDKLYSEYKVWPIARMNRIMDIYYRSEDSEYTVSSVEIKLVINNTDCLGYSNLGVGSSEFSGTIFLATNTAVILYTLDIYTCSQNFNRIVANNEGVLLNLPFYTKLRQSELRNGTS